MSSGKRGVVAVILAGGGGSRVGLGIPKQFLKSIRRTGFGPNLFDAWRYMDEGQPGQDCTNRPLNRDFVLNQARYKGASILLARAGARVFIADIDEAHGNEVQAEAKAAIGDEQRAHHLLIHKPWIDRVTFEREGIVGPANHAGKREILMEDGQDG